jgi:hypothetical protein
MLILSNALPIYGAAIGKLVFFQVIYLYWFEGLLVIGFDCIRIATARGTGPDKNVLLTVGVDDLEPQGKAFGFGARLSLILRTVLLRVAILLFYLIFIVVFVGFQLTDKSHRVDVALTMALQNQFFNTAVILFLINMTVQLLGGFFLSGRYRTVSPKNYARLFDGRTILMHVMIVGSVFIHQFFFANKHYEALGEIVYIGIFMLIRTVFDLARLRSHFAEEEAAAPAMI